MTRKYGAGVDQPHSVKEFSGAVYYYARDLSGNVLGLFSLTNVFNRYRYGPWGQSQGSAEQARNSLRFASRVLDGETGLYYNRSRYYDPQTGRFLSPDPIGLAGGLNPYVYASDDPVNRTDPFGLKDEAPSQPSPDFICPWGPSPLPCYDLPPINAQVEGGNFGDVGGGWGGFSSPSVPVSIDGGGAGGGGGNGSGLGHSIGKAVTSVTHFLKSDCAGKLGVFAISFASDAALLEGGVLLQAGRAGVKALGEGLALSAVDNPGIARALVSGATITGLKQAIGGDLGAAATFAASAGSEHFGSAFPLNVAAKARGFDVSWKDFVPFWGTGRAFSSALKSCF